jgi:hypothetical protein
LSILLVLSVLSFFLSSASEHGNISDSPIVLSLLDFISVFAESHLERCLEYSSSASSSVLSSSSSTSSNGMMSEEARTLQQNITTFFNELVSITTVSMDPKILIKLVAVWNRILLIDTVKLLLFNQTNVVIPIISHLLQASLLQSNKNLQENLDELIDDVKLDIIVDPHIKEILTKVSSMSNNGSASGGEEGEEKDHQTSSKGGGKADVLGAEEYDYVGSQLLIDITDLFAELVSSPAAKQWLQSTVNSLLLQNINSLSSSFQATASGTTSNNGISSPSSLTTQASSNTSSSASSPKGVRSPLKSATSSSSSKTQMKYYALDLCFLIRLLPMINDNKAELVLQIVTFLLQIIENHRVSYSFYTRHLNKEMIVLPLNCCQIVGQILQSCLSSLNFASLSSLSSSTALNTSASSFASPQIPSLSPVMMEWIKVIEPLITLLAQGMIEYMNYHNNGNMNSSHEIVFQGIAILLTQTLNLYCDLFDEKTLSFLSSAFASAVTPSQAASPFASPPPPPIASPSSSSPAIIPPSMAASSPFTSLLVLKGKLQEMFQNIINNPQCVSLQVYALMVCSQDIINPTSIGPILVNQLMEALQLLEKVLQSNSTNHTNGNSGGNSGDFNALGPILGKKHMLSFLSCFCAFFTFLFLLFFLFFSLLFTSLLVDVVIRVIGSMDVLTRNHSISKASRRQTLIQYFSPLQVGSSWFRLSF